ncbi:endonuclease [Pseudoxanthomonas sp. JBR18]|uniref:endonuclease n=1 Tax=Pseudoxanthomonas sp. JBR18 TaxID=2969308 RepID=UPI002305BE6D|nr:endonuclease [Pseudoxanthomonas sp. JBR18]WCE03614.1 endonuclease [Pseudoxanthomonas sp. JBR18]
MATRTTRSTLALAVFLALSGQAHGAVFINELHYDNSGTDTGEAVEVVATAGESLAGYQVVRYNGGTPYGTDTLSAGTAASCGSATIAALRYPSNGLQNGSADGLALVDAAGNLVQFLSYEGQITASSGPAAGATSTNLPVSEGSSTPSGTSLQLSGTGSEAADFSWNAAVAETFGACNAGQSFDGDGGGGSSNTAPTVVSTTPLDGATGFPAAGDLEVTFSEPVTLGNGALSLSCASSGSVPLTYASASGSGFAASTDTALYAGEACTFTVLASAVSDAEGAHPATNTVVDFTVADAGGGGGSDGYYSRVNTSNASQLRCSLHETIKGHTAYPYSGSGASTWSILEIADEDPTDSGKVLDVYKNHRYTKGSDRAGTGSGTTYNREHTWPNSLGFGSASGDMGLPYAPYTDTHMLFLTDSSYNASRGNKPYADCPSSSNCSELTTESNGGQGGGSGTYPGNSNWVRSPDGNQGSFEVWDAHKGDVARAVMYMAIRYEGDADPNTGQSEPDLELTDDRSKIVITSSSPAYMGLLSTLLAWSAADPPDDAERARNEVIYSFQGNRNPFVDHPEWATAALFTSSKPATCRLAN